MRLIAGMDEKALEAYLRKHRHDRVQMAMFHALREAGYWQKSASGSESCSESSASSRAKSDGAG